MTRKDVATEDLAAYLEEQLGEEQRALLDAALAHDSDAQRRLEQLKRIRDLLSAPAPELDGIDLVRGVKQALLVPAPARRARFNAWVVSGLAAAAGIVLAVGILARERDEEFRPKAALTPEAERWAGVQVHHLTQAGKAERIGAVLQKQEALAFSYTNGGPMPFEYLMIFAVDAQRQVHWFYPAYQVLGTDPESIQIGKGVTEQLLPDIIRQPFATGELTFHALFSRHPQRVLEVEGWLTKLEAGQVLEAPNAESSVQQIVARVVD
ncbi:MAG TPA: hypothetical protein VHM70_19480 [Polyangiaceae bacterium]|jgi:hypothetical protein|nr:hypothetical protein [Polyangiaceae bacterium]